MAIELETSYIQIDTVGVQAAQDALSALAKGPADLTPRSLEMPIEPLQRHGGRPAEVAAPTAAAASRDTAPAAAANEATPEQRHAPTTRDGEQGSSGEREKGANPPFLPFPFSPLPVPAAMSDERPQPTQPNPPEPPQPPPPWPPQAIRGQPPPTTASDNSFAQLLAAQNETNAILERIAALLENRPVNQPSTY